ncbi:LysR family transcriptional regulator [Brucella gallinifaecis]|uniref:LysR family transcriptional regulator n=1 Tax=Brucella gallinifaecis TaxID=215590 RepID=A0A502BSZ0_9HYPH|nr:LysR family transcriptional regulator [Brucella gallinifaecis]
MRRRRHRQASTGPLFQLRSGRIPMASLVQTLAVAEYLSFHRAAKALGTSQAGVSARIKALEEDLGVVLFDRNTRGVRLRCRSVHQGGSGQASGAAQGCRPCRSR